MTNLSKKQKNKVGINSADPDNDPYNRDEYLVCENGDECCECLLCNVDFFGFGFRELCGVCVAELLAIE